MRAVLDALGDLLGREGRAAARRSRSREQEHSSRIAVGAKTRTPRSWNRRKSSVSTGTVGSVSSWSSHGADQRLGLDPGVVLARTRPSARLAGTSPPGRSALAHALGRLRQELDQQAAGAPAVMRAVAVLAHMDLGRRRGGRGSGSAPTGGNRCGRPPRGSRPRAARRPGSGSCGRPGRRSWRACRGRAGRRARPRRRLPPQPRGSASKRA